MPATDEIYERYLQKAIVEINDLAHEYAMVHYHIDYANQIAQLARAGFELLEAYGVDGELISPSDDTAASYDIHYVARRA